MAPEDDTIALTQITRRREGREDQVFLLRAFAPSREVLARFRRRCAVLGEKLPERRIHGRGVAEDLGYAWSEEHQIRTFLVEGVVLPSYASRSRGLLGDFEIVVAILIHTVFVLGRRLAIGCIGLLGVL
jgi:hypothetical protein